MVPCIHSAKSKISNSAESIQLLRCDPRVRVSPQPAGGRPGVPAIRWSVAFAREKDTDQGVDEEDRSGGRADRAVPRGSLHLQFRLVRRAVAGGDEETRTPDPLLAKEMLCQLSYVPDARWVAWWAFLDSNQRPLPYQGSALTS